MFSIFKAAWPTALAIASLQLTAWPVRAQPRPPVPAPAQALVHRADPADPKAPVPAVLYASPLRTYQRFAEPPVAPWRDTNDVVRQRGGWREYSREGLETPTRDSALPAPGAAPAASHPAGASQPAAGGHSGHRMK